MNTPDVDLMELYGTKAFFLEKNALEIPLPIRVANAVAQHQLAKDGIAQHEEQRAKDEQRNRMIQAIVAMELAQANDRMRHTRVPLILAGGHMGPDEVGLGPFPYPEMMAPRGRSISGEAIPVGLDEGMVRMASQMIGAGIELAHLEKDAGLMNMLAKGPAGQMLGGVGRGIAGLAKGVAGGVAAAPGRVAGAIGAGASAAGGGIAGAARNAMSSIGQGMANIGQRAEQSLAGAGARAQSALSGQPNMNAIMARPSPGPKIPSLAPPSAASLAKPPAGMGPVSPPRPGQPGAPPAPPPPAANSPFADPGLWGRAEQFKGQPLRGSGPYREPNAVAAAAPPAGSPAAKPGNAIPPADAPAKPAAQPQAPPSQPPVQAAEPSAPSKPGMLQRMGSDLGNGQWKWKLPALAAAGLGTYAAVQGVKGVLNWGSQEAHPYKFNQGAPQMAYGVNEYGYPQLGTPLQ